jgi:hypothetical protein
VGLWLKSIESAKSKIRYKGLVGLEGPSHHIGVSSSFSSSASLYVRTYCHMALMTCSNKGSFGDQICRRGLRSLVRNCLSPSNILLRLMPFSWQRFGKASPMLTALPNGPGISTWTNVHWSHKKTADQSTSNNIQPFHIYPSSTMTIWSSCPCSAYTTNGINKN